MRKNVFKILTAVLAVLVVLVQAGCRYYGGGHHH